MFVWVITMTSRSGFLVLKVFVHPGVRDRQPPFLCRRPAGGSILPNTCGRWVNALSCYSTCHPRQRPECICFSFVSVSCAPRFVIFFLFFLRARSRVSVRSLNLLLQDHRDWRFFCSSPCWKLFAHLSLEAPREFIVWFTGEKYWSEAQSVLGRSERR